ncbi:IS200/IS605 family transposase [Acidithiobacillus ferrivorans]|nr:IS200/IS605 family transposase [Acidithiobacillus ferrivorans]
MCQNIKSNTNRITTCFFLAKYVVWCPKYRRDVLVGGADLRLKEIIRQVCSETDSEMLEMEVMPDHVHLLVEVDPQFGVHHLVKLIKGRSSRLLRQEFRWCRTRLPSLWTNSYFVSTVGGAPLEIIKQYIEQQKHV